MAKKRPRGRPPVADSKKRDSVIVIRLTAKEKRDIQLVASKKHVLLSDHVRSVLTKAK